MKRTQQLKLIRSHRSFHRSMTFHTPYSPFVMEESHPIVQLESIHLETEKPSLRESEIAIDPKQKAKQPILNIEGYKQGLREIKGRFDENVSTSFLELVGSVVAFPFQTLQSLMYPTVNLAEKRAGQNQATKMADQTRANHCPRRKSRWSY